MKKMTREQQQQALYTELFKVVNRFSKEFELDMLETIGTLEMVQLALCYNSQFIPPPEDYSDYF